MKRIDVSKLNNFSRKGRGRVRNTAIAASTIGTLYGAKKLRDHVTAVDYDKNIMVTKPSDGIEKFDMNNVEIKPQQGVMDALNANAEKLIPTHNKVPFAPSINKTVDLKTLGITQPVQSTENETNEIDNITELNEVSSMEFSNITDKKELAKKVSAGLGAGALAVSGLGAGITAATAGYLNKASAQLLSDQELKNEAIRAIHRSPELYSKYVDIYENDPHKLDSFYKEVLNMPESERGYVINDNLVSVEFSKKFKANFGGEKKKDNFLAEKIIGGLGGAAIIGGGIGSYKGFKGTVENTAKLSGLEEEANIYKKQYSKDPVKHLADTAMQYGKENKDTPAGKLAYENGYAIKYGKKPTDINTDDLSVEEYNKADEVLEKSGIVNESMLKKYISENPLAAMNVITNLRSAYDEDYYVDPKTEEFNKSFNKSLAQNEELFRKNQEAMQAIQQKHNTLQQGYDAMAEKHGYKPIDPVVEYFYSDVDGKKNFFSNLKSPIALPNGKFSDDYDAARNPKWDLLKKGLALGAGLAAAGTFYAMGAYDFSDKFAKRFGR